MQNLKEKSCFRFFPCESCNMKFLSRKYLMTHVMVKHVIPKKKAKIAEGRSFKCTICSKTFKYHLSLSSHLNNHKKSYISSIFKMVFKSLKNQVGSSTHSSTSSFNSCESKKPTSQIAQFLKASKSCNGSQTNKMPPVCYKPPTTDIGRGNQNYKLLSSKLRLINSLIRKPRMKHSYHHLKHTFVCHICHKGFHLKKNLILHVVSHSQPNYPCKECNVKFKTLCALIDHKDRLHPEETNPSEEEELTMVCYQKTIVEETVNSKPCKPENLIYIRQSASVDPHLWPKVSLSRNLNDFFMYSV